MHICQPFDLVITTGTQKQNICAKKKMCICKHAVPCFFPASSSQDPCIYCCRNVHNEDHALECDNNKKWQRISCDGLLSIREYKNLNNKGGKKSGFVSNVFHKSITYLEKFTKNNNCMRLSLSDSPCQNWGTSGNLIQQQPLTRNLILIYRGMYTPK